MKPHLKNKQFLVSLLLIILFAFGAIAYLRMAKGPKDQLPVTINDNQKIVEPEKPKNAPCLAENETVTYTTKRQNAEQNYL